MTIGGPRSKGSRPKSLAASESVIRNSTDKGKVGTLSVDSSFLNVNRKRRRRSGCDLDDEFRNTFCAGSGGPRFTRKLRVDAWRRSVANPNRDPPRPLIH